MRKMSATSSINSSSASSNSNSGNSNNSNNVLKSTSNLVLLENQILDSNDVVAAAGLQQLSNSGALKLTRDCAVQYSNLINSYTASSVTSSSSSSVSGNTTIVSNSSNNSSQMNTVNIIPGDATQTNSRVQVISNVQLVSKGGTQPSTFSYVDASGKNFNVLTSSGKLSTNKLISVPMTKVKTINHVSSQQAAQQLVPSPVPHHQQQHTIVAGGGAGGGSGVQKVSVPRSIQLVTRIPNSTISVSNGRVSQITSQIPSSPQQQQQQQQFTIQQYPDGGANLPVGLEIKSSSSGTTMVNNTNTCIVSKTVSTKGKVTAPLKIMQNTLINQAPGAKPLSKGMSVNLKSVRTSTKATANSQYYIKNAANGTTLQQQPGTTTSIYTTSPAQAVYHNPTPHPPQPTLQIPVGTTATASKTKGMYKTSKNQLIQIQQQQPHQSPQRSVTPSSSSPVGMLSTATSYGGGTSTTMVQHGPNNLPSSATVRQNYNTYPIAVSQSQCGTTVTTNNYKQYNQLYTGGLSSTTYDSSGGSPSASTISSDHSSAPSVTVTGYTAPSKGKKYSTIVNNESQPSYLTASPVKVKGTGRGRNNSQSHYQPETTHQYQRYSASPSRPTQQHLQPPPLNSAAQGSDQIFINGQQMTDETSARILQSLSQKTSTTSSGADSSSRYGGYKQQQQFTYYGSDNVPQSPSHLSTNVPSAGVVYDPSDSRFYEDKSDGKRTIVSETVTYAGNIPLREGFPSSYSYSHREDHDEQIGVEVRPAPVDTSNGKFYIIQAILQDHTYCASLPEIKLPEPPPQASPGFVPSAATVGSMAMQHNLSAHSTITADTQANLHHQYHHQSSPIQQPSHHQSNKLIPTGISSAASVSLQSGAVSTAGVTAPLTQTSLNVLASLTGSATATQVPTGQMISVNPQSAISGSGLDYIYQRQPQDDDANSVISTGSRNFNSMDNDLGEETETAPEGEGEDDSITRCICDLTHDDGYMICCDKCSAWQHVDCMGIDRMNIPDEYNCEMCQPRSVDKNRARMLQMEKRKEQTLFLANNNLHIPVADPAVSSTNLLPITGTTTTTPPCGKGANQYTTGKALGSAKKNKSNSANSKKKATADGCSAAKKSKKSVESSLNRLNGKRKELKKPSKKKVKTTEQNAEKMTTMIRTWIDSYERAITNHYSPELRARLQAFGKMQSQNPLLNSDRLMPASSAATNLAQQCTTVPHAGGKILISTGDIEPKTPIIEIRGKYMLSSQHKQLQSLFNMAANGKLNNNKNAGPFLFLYQLTNGGMELCVDTRTYGNDARFVRRSCRPNAEILHNIEKGVVHLYIVSTANIKANTEITIKHDEQLIQRVGGVVILTHTTVTNLCACGLIKECQYSAQLSEGIVPVAGGAVGGSATPNAMVPVSSSNIVSNSPVSGAPIVAVPKSSRNKKNNGALVDGEKKPVKKRNSRSTSSNTESRQRSISSSGDSTSEMLLYAQQHQQMQQLPMSQHQQQIPHSQIIGQPPLSPMQQQQSQHLQQIPPQLMSQQMQHTALHLVHQQQRQPSPQQLHENHPSEQPLPVQLNNLSAMQQSQPVYMYNPSPSHPSQLSVPQSQPMNARTPPPASPMSPVVGIGARPGFYTEIKSPINSPPLNLSSGPPPLVIPAMSSPVKTIVQMPPRSPLPTGPQEHQHKVIVAAAAPYQQQHHHHHQLQQQQEDQPRLEVIQQQQQQQHLHQQQIMEDILKIKIKSPTASPIKQENQPSSPTPASMLSPPPPPVPITQRLLCAEALKNEFFHSHHYQQQSPAALQTIVAQQQEAAQQQKPHFSSSKVGQQSSVKVEYCKSEVKRELLSPTHSNTGAGSSVSNADTLAEVKIEPEIKPEPEAPSSTDCKPVECLTPIKKEEEHQQESIDEKPVPSPAALVAEDIKEDIVMSPSHHCHSDSATNSPVKTAHPPTLCTGNVSSGNSTNSSPHSLQQSNSGSGRKKTTSISKEPHESTVKEEKKPSRKLTREERKMEAIVKAFEKMEQSQQRKQELKEQRKEGKRRSVSSSTPDESTPPGNSSAKKKAINSQKRKKKKSKSLSQHFGSPNQSRKKKVCKTGSSKGSKKKSSTSRTLSPEHDNCSSTASRPFESKAAELLLTFSQSQSAEQSQSSYFGDDVKPLSADELNNTRNNNIDSNDSNLPLLSSACMLVEAAVAPLEQAASASPVTEQDFKFPQKAKTKKSMSREWLSGQTVDATAAAPFRRVTPDQDSGYMSEDKTHDFRRTNFDDTTAMTDPLGVELGDSNMCIVAKKVEEFIAQNSPQPGGGGGDEVGGQKWDDRNANSVSSSSAGVGCLLQEANPAPANGSTVSESAAVKKRWLRQAISEETDELTQACSSPPPPNGFTTPLKKRRVIQQSDEQQPVTSSQKIDFAGQQSQSLSSVPPPTDYTESNAYWTNTGPATLTYQRLTEEKQAMDLSRTAAPVLQLVQQRIQPYKIVPIAQALTPLHFTDPDPLPAPLPTSVMLPSSTIQAHHHLIPQESHEYSLRQQQIALSAQSPIVEAPYDALPPPPPASAVAAMVPASLLPPESHPIQSSEASTDIHYSGCNYQQPTVPARGITRSKGSQKYIGSPAKFRPPSPADSLSSVAETPEKNSIAGSSCSESVANSDADEDGQGEQQAMCAVNSSLSCALSEENTVVETATQHDSEQQPLVAEPEPTEENVIAAKKEGVYIADEVDVPSEVIVPSTNDVACLVEDVAVDSAMVAQKEADDVEMQEAEAQKIIATQEQESAADMADKVMEDVSDQPLQDDPPVEENPPAKVDAIVTHSEAALQTVNGREKKLVSAAAEEDPNSELEDLQKVIASFHSENIMNLISRNKKTKKNANREKGGEKKSRKRQSKFDKEDAGGGDSKEGSVTPTASPLAYSIESETNDELDGSLPMTDSTELPSTSVEESQPIPTITTTQTVATVESETPISTLGRSYSHSSWHASSESFRDTPEIRNFSTLRPDIPSISYNSPTTYQSTAARNLLTSLSVGSEPLSTLGSYRSSTSSFLDYPKLSTSASTGLTGSTTPSSMYQYRPSTEISNLLEKGFSGSRSTSLSTLSASSASIGTERTTERVGSSFLLSTPKVTENLSTLGGTGSSYPKIFTKTASSDPRLNPALTTPEPSAPITPKRKLSINEYRQRKLQSCSSSVMSSSASEGTSVSSTSPSGGSCLISSSLGSNDVSSSISKELSLELDLELGKPTMDRDSSAASSSDDCGSSTTTEAQAQPSTTATDPIPSVISELNPCEEAI